MMRRLGFACLALLGLVAAGGSAAWYTFAGVVEENVDLWIARQRAGGIDMAYDAVAVSGYPTVWNVQVKQPRAATAARRSPPWRWRGPDMVVGFAAWAPRDFSVDATGDHEIIVGSPLGEAVVMVSAASATADITIGADGGPDLIEIAVAELALDSPDLPLGLAAGAAVLSARRHPVVGASADQPSMTLVFDGRDVALPELLDGPLGRDIARADAEARVLGVIPPGPPELAMASWRDAGGSLRVQDLQLRWGPIEMAAQGTVVLDDALQPQGTFTAQVRGLIEAVGAFERSGAIDASEAAAARLLFTALSRPGEDGGTVIVLPAVVKDQQLFFGPLPVMPIPWIRWAR